MLLREEPRLGGALIAGSTPCPAAGLLLNAPLNARGRIPLSRDGRQNDRHSCYERISKQNLPVFT